MTYRPISGPGGEPPPGPFPVPPSDSGAGRDAEAGAGAVPAAPLPTELAGPARTLFGDRLPLAAAYAELLAGPGVVRGLIGPRETPRIWDRHLLNCAVVAELIPAGSSVVDVGSGAGLPGIVLAIARPDLSIMLVEPLARRAVFLAEVVTALALGDSVTVLRARAEEIPSAWRRTGRSLDRRTASDRQASAPLRSESGSPESSGGSERGLIELSDLPAELSGPADIVTARAVAPLDRLAGWCLPLTAPGGRVLALKGATAEEEVANTAAAVRRLGGAHPVVQQCGTGIVEPSTTVVEIVRERVIGAARESAARSAAGRRSKPRR
ncbi:16S rRNA (guanine(527)-N(7))-methyltransferase RsmG [Plantactinospora soyae]|uniref:Ribosomal RNA small subunit methyltransferase G n=1 Tax=Plantactinospora soyae TaxID=1544732 RepID=A0A927M3G5_9ACTN|nr:RsmG family class I SAM-dependent methyltransferase [Plantactinospora soyae]MBE1486110.1 16S rRNA (guanine527-N7)-methyltransferase [Plantactinospora soyae]